MVKAKLDLSGRDATYLSNSHRYCNGLSNLQLYRSASDRVPSWEQLKQAVDLFAVAYEAAINGDRVAIAARKKAREALTDTFQKIVHYVQAVAEEDDIPALLQAGFEVPQRSLRRKTAVAPAS